MTKPRSKAKPAPAPDPRKVQAIGIDIVFSLEDVAKSVAGFTAVSRVIDAKMGELLAQGRGTGLGYLSVNLELRDRP